MTRPNFFADIEALNCLLQMSFDELQQDIDLTLDLTDIPYWFSFHSDEKTQTLKAYTQVEMYNKDEKLAFEKGSLTLDRASEKASVRAAEDLGENMGAFFVACRNIGCLIRDNGLESLYAGLNPEEAGILLKEKDGKLSWKVVSGRERPNLTVQTLFGGTTTGRPYMDDFWERSELDDSSIEEKIDAAEGGNTTAMDQLAMLYLNGDEEEGIEADPVKSVYWFKKLADTGDSSAMFNLGLFYAKGHGVERDFRQAADWMEKAAEAGDDDAPRLVDEYKKLADAVSKAAGGDAQAQADLADGLMKLGGSLDQAGAGKDYAESVKWAELAADQGNADAMWILALAYEHGRGVGLNKKKAAELYQKGADAGHARCLNSLGTFYINGDQVPKDEKKGFELIQQAARLGDGEAMANLGRCYQFGTGTTGNMKKAVEWYEKSLKVKPDDELARKVEVFKMLGENDPEWDQDYEGAGDDDMPDGPFDATETMRKNLQAAGKDASDEAISNMSVEEAYAAFFGSEDNEEAAETEPETIPQIDEETESSGTGSTRYSRINQLIEMIGWQNPTSSAEELLEVENLAPEIREHLQNSVQDSTYSYDEKTRTVTIKEIELTHTSSFERASRIESLRTGEILNLTVQGDDKLLVTDYAGREIGNCSEASWRLIPVIANHDDEKTEVIVTKVIPKSQRGKGAKKAIVEVTLRIKLKEINRSGVRSIICKVTGDQTKFWTQKIEVIYTNMPAEDVRKAFEIHNRDNGEYDNQKNDTDYAGLDNLADEIKAARKKMRSEIVSGQSYKPFHGENEWAKDFISTLKTAVKEEPKRYGGLLKYLDSEQLQYGYGGLEQFFTTSIIDKETFYWIYQTRVEKEEYERQTREGLYHRYEVLEAFEGKNLPVGFNDEDTVSVFGTDSFIALADLSYGC